MRPVVLLAVFFPILVMGSIESGFHKKKIGTEKNKFDMERRFHKKESGQAVYGTCMHLNEAIYGSYMQSWFTSVCLKYAVMTVYRL
jgi:hypothetical protein